jgi:hypothetical protein
MSDELLTVFHWQIFGKHDVVSRKASLTLEAVSEPQSLFGTMLMMPSASRAKYFNHIVFAV